MTGLRRFVQKSEMSSILSLLQVYDIPSYSAYRVMCFREKSTVRSREEKRVMQKVNKFLSERPKMRQKLYDTTPSAEPSVTISYSSMKTLNTSSDTVRVRARSHLLLRETQDIINSGIVGDEVAQLDVVLTTAIHDNNNTCRVLWEPQGFHQDQLICTILNRSAKHIRHVLMHGHALGRVPSLEFVPDQGVILKNKFDKAFDQLKIEEDMARLGEEEIVEHEASKTGTDSPELDPIQKMFGIDQQQLMQKVLAAKFSHRQNSESREAKSDAGILLSGEKGDDESPGDG